MARNTIVAIMLGVSATMLTVMAVLGIIEGDVYATALTGITSLGTVLHWLWPLQIETIDPTMLVKLWAMKVFGTIILGFLGGLTGMFGKDVYKIIKTKLRENKNLGSNRSSGVDSSDSLDS